MIEYSPATPTFTCRRVSLIDASVTTIHHRLTKESTSLKTRSITNFKLYTNIISLALNLLRRLLSQQIIYHSLHRGPDSQHQQNLETSKRHLLISLGGNCLLKEKRLISEQLEKVGRTHTTNILDLRVSVTFDSSSLVAEQSAYSRISNNVSTLRWLHACKTMNRN